MNQQLSVIARQARRYPARSSTTSTTRRLLSSPTQTRQPMSLPPTAIPIVISRRAWQAFRKANPIPKPPPIKPVEDTTTWPKSVVYGAGVACAVLIPYFATWFVAANPTLRESLSNSVVPNLEDRLRGHFGEPDPDSISYTETIEQGLPVPRILPQEWSAKVRAEQRAVQEMMQNDLQVNIQLVDSATGMVLGESDTYQAAPGSTPARPDAVAALLDWDKSSGSLSAVGTPGGLDIAVEFPDQDDVVSEAASSDDGTLSWGSDLQALSDRVDPLLSATPIFSSWHYQQPVAEPAPSSGKPQKDTEEMRLEYELAELEIQLRTPNTSRPVDDIMEDMQKARAELRRYKWGKFMSWK